MSSASWTCGCATAANGVRTTPPGWSDARRFQMPSRPLQPVKMHTLLDLRGNIPSFLHISDGKMADVHALDLLTTEPGAYTSWIAAMSISAACIRCIDWCVLRDPCQIEHEGSSALFGGGGSRDGRGLRPDDRLGRPL